jgi:hypothetical protein
VSALGLRPALLAAATLYGVTTLAPFAFPVWRQMDRDQPRPSPPENDGGPRSRAGSDMPTLASRTAEDQRTWWRAA